MAAAGALSAPPDGRPVLGQPGVHHPIVVGQAPRASHVTRLVPLLRAHAVATGRSARSPWPRYATPQGRTICSPGTTVSDPVCAASLATSGRGSAVGSTRSAIVHRVSPGCTV